MRVVPFRPYSNRSDRWRGGVVSCGLSEVQSSSDAERDTMR